jgi:HlyD family secretion protein
MKQDKLGEQLEDANKLVVIAEQAGLVVYDNGQRGWNPTARVAVGEKFYPRQQVLVIPEMGTLQVKTKVYEASIDQVHSGVPAFITLDARPEMKLSGKVSKVAPLPDSQNRWLNPGVKVYDVTIAFDQMPENLKPGMTAQVEMVLAKLPDVLSVPVAAVFGEQERTFCHRVWGGKVEKVDVKIGRTNDKRVEILSGLAEGDEVMLAPPSSEAPRGGNGKDKTMPIAVQDGQSKGGSK